MNILSSMLNYLLTKAQSIALANANNNITAAINAYNALDWSTDVPEASAAGDYYVIYRVVETDNYFAAPALSEIPTLEEIAALKEENADLCEQAFRVREDEITIHCKHEIKSIDIYFDK